MTRVFLTLSLVLASLGASGQSLFPNLGGQRTGISGLQFLKIPISAEQAALAGANISTASDASAMFVNPAMTVEIERNSLSVSYAPWFAELAHSSASVVYKPASDWAFGLGFIALNAPPTPVTTELNPDGTGETFAYGDVSASLSVARRLTTQFSFGVTASFVQQTIASLRFRTYLLDAGVCYKIPFAGMRLAAAFQNFGPSAKTKGKAQVVSPSLSGAEIRGSFDDVDPPTLFRLAFSFEPISTETQKLTAFAQLNHPNDNKETISLALEYGWKNLLFLRAGYNAGRDEQTIPDLGAGLRYDIGFATLRFDYAFVNFKTLGGTHRLTLSLGGFNL
ncbi:MAG: PorV/PorQ family protein [Chloroherpetonaceae bacterium]|nr:PorV/PorQ family protein [Chloroherpetonaceae bacterium]MDW8438540.1 PorV/PorQ family protein [Chloroherpetonaceae bacterium]